jgi:hypothetical protein
MGTRSLKKYLQPLLLQSVSQHTQWIEQRLSASDNNSLRSTSLSACNHNIYIHWWKYAWIPGILGITPATPHVTTTQANEIRRLARMEAFALNCIKVLDQWQTASTIEQLVIRQ